MTTPPARLDEAAITAFWDAAAHTSEDFVSTMRAAGARGEETPEFTHLAHLLHQIDPHLLLIVGGTSQERPEIVISAGGIAEVFPAVLAVANAAPDTVKARYAIRAFRPRMPDPDGLSVRLKGKDLPVSSIRWDATAHHDQPSVCDLTLYIPGWIDAFPADSLANRRTAESVFLLLDHLIGERAVVMQIAGITWRSDKEAAGLPTLATLPHHLDRIAAQ